MMLLELMKALALHAPNENCYIGKVKLKFQLQEKGIYEKTKKQLSRNSDDETKNDLLHLKDKQFHELIDNPNIVEHCRS